MAERAYGTMKDTIEIRPIHHHLRDPRPRRTSSSACSPTTLLSSSKPGSPELLFTDDTPLAPADPVKPASRSAAANTKAGSATTTDGLPAHTLTDLLADLGTISFSGHVRG